MKKSMFYVILFSFFTVGTGFMAPPVYDGSVFGTVCDDEELTPLGDVRVIYNDLLVDVTDESGEYFLVFTGLLEGEVKYYDVKFSKDKYQELTVSIRIMANDITWKDVYMWLK